MSIWAIADLHLCFGLPEKTMEIFGPVWKNYTQKIQNNWEKNIHSDDLVLIAGDISWAMKLEDAKKDLLWIDSLPGKKVLIKGNHDYWWNSFSKVKQALPPSLVALQNGAYLWNDIAIGGTRLWESSEYNFAEHIVFTKNPLENKELALQEDLQEKIFIRELHKLQLSLAQMSDGASLRIAMTHYPPIGTDLAPSQASALLEKYNINICVFGHLHSVKPGPLFGKANAIQYYLTSCDYLDFCPLKIL